MSSWAQGWQENTIHFGIVANESDVGSQGEGQWEKVRMSILLIFNTFSRNCLVTWKKSSNFAPAFRGHYASEASNPQIIKSKQNKMIIVPVKEGENIERALKKFKRKFEKTGVVKELRARQQFNKPSVLKRLKMEHAIYVQKLRNEEE